ncbi:hypothetical protein R7O11_26690, partial [Vibrio sp. Vb2362]|nr:hypothetical protein [Vibrio sp. Vb2362]
MLNGTQCDVPFSYLQKNYLSLNNQQHKRTKTMRYVVTLMILIFASNSVFADDSETNLLAKKIKTKLQKKVDNKFD